LIHPALAIVVGLAAAAALLVPTARGRVHRANHNRHRQHHRQAPKPTPAVPAQCAGADSTTSSTTLRTLRAAVTCLINRQRTQRGLPALAVSDQLNRSAQAWTNTMARTGRFTHGPRDAFAKRISADGYVWQSAGENIAAGFETPRLVVAAWMTSTDHCRNILDPSYRDVGNGESNGTVGPNGNGTWTQDFGLRLGQAAPSRNPGPMNGCPY
jgi:uncharacterized protein YkwD